MISKKLEDIPIYPKYNSAPIKQRLITLAKTNEIIIININDYQLLFTNNDYLSFDDIDLITDRHILQQGHYASILNMKIYVKRIVAEGEYIELTSKQLEIMQLLK